jgi:cytochrome c
MNQALPWIAALALAAPAAWAGPEDAFNKAGCNACHLKDRKGVGPALKDIAVKYKGQDVTATLVQKVRAGGKGVWGPVPMAPYPPDKIADADLKAAVEWILAM